MVEFSVEMPMELMTEILARLPVKSLVRFMCVCKGWRSLISSPEFASLHLSCYHTLTDEYPLWLTNFDNCNVRGTSVNGLFIFSRPPFDAPDDQSQLELMLWNPMIGKTRKLPTHSIDRKAWLGFGFRHLRSECLVVAICRLPNTSVDVYSLSTGSWKSIFGYNEDIVKEVVGDGHLVVDGVMHFVSVNIERSSHMVLYDMNVEMFSYIKLPCQGSGGYPVVYHEKLGLLDFDYQDYCCTLWVMEKDGKPDSWCKLYTIGLNPGITAPQMLAFRGNENFFILVEEGKAVMYDFESKKAIRVRVETSDMMGYCFPFKESLLLLN